MHTCMHYTIKYTCISIGPDFYFKKFTKQNLLKTKELFNINKINKQMLNIRLKKIDYTNNTDYNN